MSQIKQLMTETALDRRRGRQSWRVLSMLWSESFIIWRLRRLSFPEHFTNATRAMHCAVRVRCHSGRAKWRAGEESSDSRYCLPAPPDEDRRSDPGIQNDFCCVGGGFLARPPPRPLGMTADSRARYVHYR